MFRSAGIMMAGMLAATSACTAEEISAEGTVTAVNTKEKKLNISHGPIKALGMAGMTMEFPVMDPAMLSEVKPGSKIKFFLNKDSGGNLVISDLELMNASAGAGAK